MVDFDEFCAKMGPYVSDRSIRDEILEEVWCWRQAIEFGKIVEKKPKISKSKTGDFAVSENFSIIPQIFLVHDNFKILVNPFSFDRNSSPNFSTNISRLNSYYATRHDGLIHSSHQIWAIFLDGIEDKAKKHLDDVKSIEKRIIKDKDSIFEEWSSNQKNIDRERRKFVKKFEYFLKDLDLMDINPNDVISFLRVCENNMINAKKLYAFAKRNQADLGFIKIEDVQDAQNLEKTNAVRSG
jgi:hypothetical protein